MIKINKKTNKKTDKKTNKKTDKKTNKILKGGMKDGDGEDIIFSNTFSELWHSQKFIDFKTETETKTETNRKNNKLNYTYFNMEKLTEENYGFWLDYVKMQICFTNRGDYGAINNTQGSIKAVNIYDGAKAFFDVLSMFYNDRKKYEDKIFIAFSSSQPYEKFYNIEGTLSQKKYSQYISLPNIQKCGQLLLKHAPIEMCFTVFFDQEYPLTSHVGIFKNLLYFLKQNDRRMNLSEYLHSFAAKVIKKICEEKGGQVPQYMFTNPTRIMGMLLYKTFKKRFRDKLNNKIWIGNYIQRNDIKKQITENNSYDPLDYYTDFGYSIIPKELDESQIPVFDRFPLYNQFGDEWVLRGIDDKLIKFKEPYWITECRYLTDSLLTFLINIEELSKIF